jgi:aminopeptidase N
MQQEAVQTKYLKDYQVSPFLIDKIFMHFDLDEHQTHVKSILNIRKNPQSTSTSSQLVLDGSNLQLISIALDGDSLENSRFKKTDHTLVIDHVPDEFILETEVIIKPQENTLLSGLYKSNRNFCTQCESEGFRRITYFIDRPDILTQYTTTISADRTQFPILLSNGNLTDSHELPNNRHWVKWEDPTRKPSYLFALVAGNFDILEDQFITQSGRNIALKIYVEPGKRDFATYAMQVLKDAMQWDERKYGREYDLDIYMIVAVNDFNFGAMENKGLNIFNDRFILVHPETATDVDYLHVQSVVAHEYFHNWTGNRVTVRDWFQITLKEGLTVFRENQFCSDMNSKAVRRIEEAKMIRNQQFQQDASPLAHPIYPDSYIEINNFYTVTVYEKGAEVIRMFHTLLGQDLFRKAMDHYFDENDGYPVTVEEFIKSMEQISRIDFAQFRRWYTQSGTPTLIISDEYDAPKQQYTLHVTQRIPSTAAQPHKENLHIPLMIGLLDPQGREILWDSEKKSHSTILDLNEEQQDFVFYNIPSKPVPSLLRDFSAPVKIEYNYSEDDLSLLIKYDSDLFSRWDASQKMLERILFKIIDEKQSQQSHKVPEKFLHVLAEVFRDETIDDAFKDELLALPTEKYLIEQRVPADVDSIHFAHEWLMQQIANFLHHDFLNYFQQHRNPTVYTVDFNSIAARRLKKLALTYLVLSHKKEFYQEALTQFHHANNMTDVLAAMQAVNDIDCEEREQMLSEFYFKWSKNPLVLDKWYALQAQSTLPDTLATVKRLAQNNNFDFKNPNRVRSLVDTFAVANPYRFHAIDGTGYEFLADYVLKTDPINPQLASRLAESLINWKKFDSKRQQLMHEQLQRILNFPKLSKNVYEIVSKAIL